MSTYSDNLKIEEIGTGEQAGTWGNTTNDNFQNVFEQAIVGRVTVPFSNADVTLTATNSVASQSFRNVYLNCTGTNTAAKNLIVPTINKNYVVQNNTTGGFNIVVKTVAGTGITVPNGKTVAVYADGTNVIQAFDYFPSASTGALTVSSLTDTGLTSGRVTYATTGGLLTDDADFTFNGTTVTMANDASISGLTVGKGVGTNNTLFGFQAGSSATGSYMTAIGYQAGQNNTDATYGNDFFGNGAGKTNTSGGGNTAVGQSALSLNTTGNFNSAVGYEALKKNTTGANSSALGLQALNNNTTGANNTGLGHLTLFSNTTASNNTAVGYQALYSNTTGTPNEAFGYRALYLNTTGNTNSAFGINSLNQNTTGTNNNAFGAGTLFQNTTGNYNTAFGVTALNANTTASNNTAVGYQAGYSCIVNSDNTFIGKNSGYYTTGGTNTFVGVGAGAQITTGTKNTIIGGYYGNQGGLDIRTASNYIVISDGDGNPRGIFNNNGDFLVNKTSVSATSGNGIYVQQASGQLGVVATNDVVVEVCRLGSDGVLINFRQDGTTEGNISVSGTTVSYNGGHLARWSQLPDNSKDDSILKGTVLTNLDDMCTWAKGGEVLPNEQLNKMKVSDVEGDTNVAGVFVNWTRDEDCNSDDMNIAMTGDMIIRIADDVVVQKGDLLMSAGDGTAKPQGDDIVRSKTIAKVTSNYVTCTYADGSYCVPCVLMAC